jgi:hypothetical protein
MKRWFGLLPVPLLHPYTKLVTMEVGTQLLFQSSLIPIYA